MSRHQARQQLAREFGATNIVTERGYEGVARIQELTHGIGADAALECAGCPGRSRWVVRVWFGVLGRSTAGLPPLAGEAG